MALSSQKNPPSNKTANARQPIKSRSSSTNKRKRGHRRSAFRIYSSLSSSLSGKPVHDDASTCSTSEASARHPEVQPISPEKFVTHTWAGANWRLPIAPTPNPAGSLEQPPSSTGIDNTSNDDRDEQEEEKSWQPTCFPAANVNHCTKNHATSSGTATCRSSWSAKPKQQVPNSLASQMRQLTL